MKNRDRSEIIAQILECANCSRVRLTKIMYIVCHTTGTIK